MRVPCLLVVLLILVFASVPFSEASKIEQKSSNHVSTWGARSTALPTSPQPSLLQQTACITPPSGLVGWWPGEGNATDVAGGSNGTLQNGTGFAPARVGQGFRFDGVDDYVLVPSNPAINPVNAISIEVWFSGTPTGTFQQLVAKFNHNSGGAPDDHYTLGIFPDGRLQFAISTTQNPGGIGVDSLGSVL